MIERPAIGNECNGCGLCCTAQICSIGSYTLKLVDKYGERAGGPCPAIVKSDDGAIRCGMVLRPKDHAWGKGGAHELRQAVKLLIGAGMGCDEQDDADPNSDAKLDQIQAEFLKANPAGKINAALGLWLGVK